MVQQTAGYVRSGGEEPPERTGFLHYNDFYRHELKRLVRDARLTFGGDLGHAEDLAQAAMVAVFEHWPTVRGLLRPQQYAYVKTCMVRLGAEGVQRERGFRDRLPGLWNREDRHPVESTVLDAVSAVEALRVVDRLPQQQRVVLVLTYDGYSIDEIAEFMNLSPGGVRSHLHLARAKMRKSLRGRGGDGHA